MSIAVVAVPSTAAELSSPSTTRPGLASLALWRLVRHSVAAEAMAVTTPSTWVAGAPSSDQANETRNANRIMPPSARLSQRSPVPRRKIAVARPRPNTIKNCVRKKRGLTSAAGKSNNAAVSPLARRRQKMGSMGLSRAVNERHQLGPRGLVFLECAAHGAGQTKAVRLADAPDRHARMGSLQDNTDAARLKFVHEQIRDFLRHAFLDLWPPGEKLYHARQLAEADDLSPGQVGDVSLTKERKQMVFAHACETNVFFQHHLVVLLRELLLQMLTRIAMHAGEEFRVHAGHTIWGFDKPFAVGIFSDRQQDFADRRTDALLVYRCADRVVVVRPKDAPGIARAAVHRRLFLHQTLLFAELRYRHRVKPGEHNTMHSYR